MLSSKSNSNFQYISFATATQERMRIKSSGDVGIGTNNPGAKLAVESTGNTSLRITSGSTSNSILEFGDTGDHDVGRIDYDNDNDWMSFYTNGGDRMRITSEGYTTIGAYVQSPRTFIDTTAYYAPDNLPLLIHGGSGGNDANEAGNCGIGFNTRYRKGHIKNAIICEPASWGRGILHFCCADTVGAGAENYKVSLSDSRMVVKHNGNVGIGTNNPTNSLHVYKAAGEATSGLLIEKASGDVGTAAALLSVLLIPVRRLT